MKFSFILSALLCMGTMWCTQAQIVNIPDPNFKNALVNTLCVPLNENSCEGFFPVDINGNGEIEVEEAEGVEHLCVSIQDIASLEGIQAFINLESLHVQNNELTAIDLSQNTLLRELYAGGNMITSIDVSNLSELTILNISDNDLTFLDVSVNLNLFRLNCALNNLVSLNINQNPLLDTLKASNNDINAIDISQNSVLKIVDVGNNNIESINLSQNPELIDISVDRNQITSLDVTNKPELLKLVILENPIEGAIDVTASPLLNVLIVEETLISELNIQNGNNENFTMMRASDTPNLFCIQVDDPVAATAGTPPYDDWEIDPQDYYSADCSLGTNDVDATQLEVYPNPTGDTLFINSKMYELINVVIYNLEGKEVLQLDNVPSQISLAPIPSGILFVKITTNQGIVTKKIMKK